MLLPERAEGGDLFSGPRATTFSGDEGAVASADGEGREGKVSQVSDTPGGGGITIDSLLRRHVFLVTVAAALDLAALLLLRGGGGVCSGRSQERVPSGLEPLPLGRQNLQRRGVGRQALRHADHGQALVEGKAGKGTVGQLGITQQRQGQDTTWWRGRVTAFDEPAERARAATRSEKDK